MRVMKWIGLLGLVAGLTAALQSTSRAALAQDQRSEEHTSELQSR